MFKPYHVTLHAADADDELCFSASHVTANAYPVIDAAKVVDLGI